MDAMLWMFLPMFVAAGSALMTYFIMQSKLEVAVAKERETMAEARATIAGHAKSMEETIRSTEERSRRQALDDFLADFRVEERHYTRESKSLFLNRKSMVLQERLFFRNIPLSNWVEHEMVVEDGGDIQKLAKACSIFSAKSMTGDAPTGIPQLGGGGAIPVSSPAGSAKLLSMDSPQPRRKGIAG
jgi:hypothetical protein